jgi:hypothetical protein
MTLVDGPNTAVPVSGVAASEDPVTDKLLAGDWALAWFIASTDTRLATVIITPVHADQRFNRHCLVIAASVFLGQEADEISLQGLREYAHCD